ncbi:MAG: PTS sugar transporter subunit IIA [Kiritimatiellia bacterium]
MSIAEYINRKRVVLLKSKTKKGAFSELLRLILREEKSLARDEVLTALLEREALFSTRIAPGIAIPHAQIPRMKQTLIAVGKSIHGITYDARSEDKVHLVFLIVGGTRNHLRALGAVAALLQNREVSKRLLAATEKPALYALLEQGTSTDWSSTSGLSVTIGRQALELARHIRAASLIVHNATPLLRESFREHAQPPRIIFAGTSGPNLDLSLPFRGLNRTSQLEISLLLALAQGLVRKGEKIVSVFGLADNHEPDTIVVSDVDKEFKTFLSSPLTDETGDDGQQTFIRTLQLATELAAEGREGKPVGALFVVGDYDRVATHTQQMVINPFKGYDDSEKNILDPGLAETVKEFAHIDGAFIIRADGVIASAGTYLRVDHPSNLPSGLGARHAAAAGITAITKATAIAISESTRSVSLFRGGERIMVV